MGNVNELVLDRLRLLFGAPARIAEEDLPAYLREYRDSLDGYSDDNLRRGMDWLRDHHKYRSWPTPGEIHAACKRFQPKSSSVESKGWRDADALPTPTDEQKERVQAMVDEMKRNIAAKQMPKEGYIDRMPLDVSRPSFEKSQREGDQRLHMTHDGLTNLSRRMTGEGE